MAKNERSTDNAPETQAAPEAAAIPDGHVMVMVPKDYTLTRRFGLRNDFKSGIYPMKREDAEHPYSAANGVVVVG